MDDLIDGLGTPEAPQEDLIAGLGTAEAPVEDLVTGLGTAEPAGEDLVSGLGTATPERMDFTNVYDNQRYGEVASRYYTRRLGRQVDAREGIDMAISAGRWADSNTAQNAIELARTSDMSDEDKADFAELRQGFQNLPAFWDKGGAGAAGLAENVARGFVDPVNLIGGPLAKGLAAGLGRVAPRVASWLARPAGRIATTAAVDGVASAGGNLANQRVENQVGLRDGYSMGEAALAGVVGAGLSSVGNVLTTRGGSGNVVRPTGVPEVDALQSKIGDNPLANRQDTVVAASDQLNARLFDNGVGAAVIQEAGPNGFGRSANALRDQARTANQTGAVDPGDAPYIRYRLLPASIERSDQFIMRERFLPAERGARAGTAEAGYGRVTGEGLDPILQSAEKAGIPSEWLTLYTDAMRARWLREARNPAITAKALQNPTGGPAKTIGSYFDDPQAYMAPGVTRAQAEQMAINSVDTVINTLGAVPGMRAHFDRLQSYLGGVAEYNLSAGVINIDQLARMRGAGIPVPHGVEFAYMPWMPASNGRADLLSTVASGKAPSATGAPILKRLSGSTGNRAPGVERLVTYTKRSIAAADRNLFNLSFVDHAMAAQAAGGYGGKTVLRKMDQTAAQQALKIAEDDARKALADQGVAAPTADQVDLLAASILGERNGGVMINGRQAIVAIRNGVQEVYEVVDPEIAKMFSAMSPEQLGATQQFMRSVARYRSDLITGNPVFMLKDFVRNAIDAAVNTKFGSGLTGASFGNSVEGAKLTAKGSFLNRNATSRQQAQDFIAEARRSGVGFSSNRAASMVAQHGGDVSKYKTWADYAHSNFLVRGWQGWLELGNKVEMIARLGEYSLARQAGMSGPASALMGRDVATDFAKRGSSDTLRMFAGVSSFLNAGIQGGHRAYNSLFKERSAWSSAAIITSVVTPMIALHALNAGQEAYDNLTPEQRAQGLWLSIPTDFGEMMSYLDGSKTSFKWASDGGEVEHRSPEATLLHMPLPQHFAAIGTVVNGLVDIYRTGDPTNGLKTLIQGVMGALPGLHPPDLIEPAVRLSLNKDGLGQQITPPALEGAGADAARASTPQWAIDMGELQRKVSQTILGPGREGFVLFTPIELDYLAKHFLPGFASIITQGLGQAGHNEGLNGPRPAPRDEDFDIREPTSAVARGFLRSGEGQAPQINTLYDLAKRADTAAKAEQRATGSVRGAQSYQGRSEPAQETVLLRGLGPGLQTVTRTLSEFLKQMDNVAVSQTLSDTEKRTQMNALNAQRNQYAREMLQGFRKQPELAPLFATWLNPNPASNTGETNIARDLLRARPSTNAVP